jgi:serine protease AprX
MKGTIYLIILIVIVQYTNAQEKYFVSFSDKVGTPYSIENPGEFLTEKAIERRLNQGLAIEEFDLPVSPNYIHQIKATGAKVLYPLKWFNGVIIDLNNTSIEIINTLPFVTNTIKVFDPMVKATYTPEEDIFPIYRTEKDPKDYYDYASSSNQIKMLNGNILHNRGYRGKGITIAVLDGGFLNANILPAFDSLWVYNRIKDTKDFVNPKSDIYLEHSHGMLVLSVLSANIPGEMIGTAPEASYILVRCEDTNSEQIVEEYNWAAAAEYADSIGADIINSSLGYYDYDASWQNHTYKDLDGNTTPIAKAANFASKTGMLVVASAGNEGAIDWKQIITPADAFECISVGAVNSEGIYANFSSIGPSADGRVKPEVIAQGVRTAIQTPNGVIGAADGTSLSAPIISGLAACLWQAFPWLSAKEVRSRILQSASHFNNPNHQVGYGLPNFSYALDSIPSDYQQNDLVVFPNPTFDKINIRLSFPLNTPYSLMISSIMGSIVHYEQVNSVSMVHSVSLPSELPPGVYLVQVNSNYGKNTGRIIKN